MPKEFLSKGWVTTIKPHTFRQGVFSKYIFLKAC